MLAEPLAIARRIVRSLDALGISYVVGGSVASSLYGIPRATNDVDIVADLSPEQVGAFVHALENEFYVDADMIRDTIRRRASFNVVELKTMLKIDVFIFRRDAWSREEMSRARVETFDEQPVRFATPEDTILHKLWYRVGGNVSDRQWGDVIGVLQIQRGKLDEAYLDRWAKDLDVEELLKRAREEAR